MRIKLLSILCLLLLTSCSQIKNNEVAIVEPYKLTKEQASILQMTPFQEGNSIFYNVTLKNDKDEINATIDYYNNGKKTKEIANIATSHFSKKKVKLSFLPPHFQFDKDIQEKSVNSSATTTIQSIKNLKYNQKTTLAAVIQTSQETVSVPTIDEEKGIDLLLKENEHVYLFSIELKKEQ